MLLLPDDIFRDRMTLVDATALRDALESPVQEGPTFAWGVITTGGVEQYGSPSGRAPTTGVAATSWWPQAFPTELLALAIRTDPAATYTLRVYVPKLQAPPVRVVAVSGGPDLRVDLEDDNGNGAIMVPAQSGVLISAEASGVGSLSVTPYLRRRLRG